MIVVIIIISRSLSGTVSIVIFDQRERLICIFNVVTCDGISNFALAPISTLVRPALVTGIGDGARGRGGSQPTPLMTELGGHHALWAPNSDTSGTVTKHTVFGKINSLLLINPHAITYAMVEVFCPYRLG